MFFVKSDLKIVATLLAKNEEDIIATNIEHHIDQGIEQIIVTDNNSRDRTKEIAAKYKEVVEIIDESDNTHNQSQSVTKMAKLACRFKPNWIVHLDADELWCGFHNLRHIKKDVVGSVKMLLHPPCGCSFDLKKMRFYLDFENTGLPDECKIIHRPNPDIEITHGNHGIKNNIECEFTKEIWRHHYPVRSLKQFRSKTVDGHESLKRRNAICERWEKWYNAEFNSKLDHLYDQICTVWTKMINHPNRESLLTLLEFWSTDEVIRFFKEGKQLPDIGQWPKESTCAPK